MQLILNSVQLDKKNKIKSLTLIWFLGWYYETNKLIHCDQKKKKTIFFLFLSLLFLIFKSFPKLKVSRNQIFKK